MRYDPCGHTVLLGGHVGAPEGCPHPNLSFSAGLSSLLRSRLFGVAVLGDNLLLVMVIFTRAPPVLLQIIIVRGLLMFFRGNDSSPTVFNQITLHETPWRLVRGLVGKDLAATTN